MNTSERHAELLAATDGHVGCECWDCWDRDILAQRIQREIDATAGGDGEAGGPDA